MKEKLTKLYEKTKKELAKHITDSTAIVVLSTPLFGAIETLAAKIPIENSEHARVFGAQITYLGMGKLYAAGLDFSRKKFGILQSDPEKRQQTHDTLYGFAYCTAISPLFYLAAGVRDPRQIAIGTACGMRLSLVTGGPSGFMIDAYRDFFGIHNSERLPSIIQSRGRAFKVGLAGALAAASIGITSGVYSLADYLQTHKNQSPITESQE